MLGMAITHYGGGLPGLYRPNQVIAFWDGRAMPLFLVVSGYAMRRFSTTRERTGGEVFGRAFMLLVLGLALEHQVGAYVILQFYAIYYGGVWLLRRAGQNHLVAACVGVAVVGAVAHIYAVSLAQRFAGPLPPAPSHVGELALLGHPATLLLQLAFLGEYAFFPSFAFVLVGMLAAGTDNSLAAKPVRLLGYGALLLVVALLLSHGAQTAHPKPAGFFRDASGRARLTTDRLDQLSRAAHLSGLEFVRSRLGPDPSDDAVIELATLPETQWRSPWRLASTREHSQMLGWIAASAGFALLVIGGCSILANRHRHLIQPIARAGQCALTFYVAHLLLINLYWDGFRNALQTPGSGLAKASHEAPIGARILGALAYTLDDAEALEFAQSLDDDGSRQAGRCDDVAGTWTLDLANEADDLPAARWQSRFEFAVNRRRKQRELNASGRLEVLGVSEADEPHLLEDPPYALTELLPELQVGTDPRDTWIPREPSQLRGFGDVYEAGKTTGAADLDPGTTVASYQACPLSYSSSLRCV